MSECRPAQAFMGSLLVYISVSKQFCLLVLLGWRALNPVVAYLLALQQH